ncbi:hypothetical protein EVAR_86287_1 [Eumeta japonica]|uniref:Uncharacterized protein n=1 Tax=Eumeta variegata TaxID=151549 RepID=A0A4C1UCQ4_EUMVA|nr:hypothetical protein EVAR_86287_1 [Eumeta japonica]
MFLPQNINYVYHKSQGARDFAIFTVDLAGDGRVQQRVRAEHAQRTVYVTRPRPRVLNRKCTLLSLGPRSRSAGCANRLYRHGNCGFNKTAPIIKRRLLILQ